MKAIKTLFFAFVLTLLSLTSVLANTPPAPAPGATAKGAGAMSTNAVPTTGYPIDQNIVFLMVGGMILGITVLYKNKLKKASI